jgi:hypothetical protein
MAKGLNKLIFDRGSNRGFDITREPAVKLLSIRSEPRGSGSAVARLDIELNDDLRLFNLRLNARAAGRTVYAPNAMRSRVATFSPTFVEAISCAAGVALLERWPHVNR